MTFVWEESSGGPPELSFLGLKIQGWNEIFGIKDKATDISAAFLFGRGGSTRYKYAFRAGKQDILGVMSPTDADVDNLIITMESGTFEEVVVIVPTTTSNGWTFRMP